MNPRWQARATTHSASADVVRVHTSDDVVLTRSEVLTLLVADADFRELITSSLAGARFESFFWETPPWTKSTMQRPFEFVLVNAPALSTITADADSFRTRFIPDEDTATFSNLTGDAVLVVPCPRGPHPAYAHLASFVRHAPHAQVLELWRALANAIEQRLSDKPMWVSTAGLGVSWLHLRLDARPKYYRHSPYKQAT
jgi:hypothetical protein